jgi:uncharacterized membrane protein
MEDSALFLVACALPVVALWAIAAWAMRSGDRRSASAAHANLESRLIRLERENLALLQRMTAVERYLQGPIDALPGAPRPPEPRQPPTEPAPIDALPSAPLPPEPRQPPTEPAHADALPGAPQVPEPRQPPTEPAHTGSLPGAPEAPEPRTPSFSLEQWIGVKGAAAVGSLVLMLAGVYFFKYSIEHGLLSPTARVVIGMLAGLGCVLFSELRLRTRHVTLANWLAGAGAGILYLASWAGVARYHLYGVPTAFALMVSVTAATCALSVRHRSQAIALLGLLGGFATPVLLSTGSDRPIALFAYLFVLNGALLAVGRRRGWPLLGLLSLIATALYQLGWIGYRMDGPRSVLGLAILGLFALLFTALARPPEETSEAKAQLFRWTRLVAVALPFFFGLFFTLRADLELPLYPTALLLLVLTGMAGFIARESGPGLLPTVTSSVALAVVAGYVARGELASSRVVAEAFLSVAALASVLAGFAFWDHRAPSPTAQREGAPPALAYGGDVLGLGGLLVLAAAAGQSGRVASGAILAAAFALAAPLLFTARLPGRGPVPRLVAAGVAFVFMQVGSLHLDQVGSLPESVFFGLVVLAAVFLTLPAVSRTIDEATRRAFDHGAALGAVLLLPLPALFGGRTELGLYLGTIIGLYALAAMAAARLGRGGYLVALVIYGGLTHDAFHHAGDRAAFGLVLELVAFFGLGLVTALFPAYLGEAARRSRATWRAAALAPVCVFPVLYAVFIERFGDAAIGALPTALAAVACGTAALAGRLPADAGALRKTAFVWPAVVALGFLTAAIPLQLENEWVTIGWALQGAAALLLFRRVDHAGLKYYAGALFTVVTIRLTLNPWLLSYHPSGWPILNWLAYTYLVPVACLLFGAATLAPIEVARYRPAERATLPLGAPLVASSLVVFAVVVGFAWINLTIADAFSEGRHIELITERRPARDLTLSLAWALYACLLVFAGMWRRSGGLRGLSLGLMILTCAKVFLYDLGNLEDLYRVASLVGLALSLIALSLAYQRFVFRKPPEED